MGDTYLTIIKPSRMRNVVFILSAFLAVSVGQEGWDYCSGVQVLNESSGVITDHYGGGNYRENVICTWIIQPAAEAKYLTIEFTKFSIELGWDSLTIYNGNSTTDTLYGFSGYTIPPIITTITPSVTIIFRSDSLITYSGFSLHYSIANCENSCSGHGYCHFNECNCYGGLTGPTCEQYFCNDTTCGSNGYCSHEEDKCICEIGYYGGDCQGDFCAGEVVLDLPIGTFSDHRGDSDYLPYANCTWLIAPPHADSIMLRFLSFSTDEKDVVDIYDGNDNSILLTSLQGYRPVSELPPIVSYSGKMRIVFRSDGTMQRQGFTVHYESASCPFSCSDHGVCNFGSCICDIGWQGLSCNESFCVNNCSSRGDCVNGVCLCNEGYIGLDCSATTNVESCATISNYTNLEGEIAFAFHPNAPCMFVINPGDVGSITLRFDFYNFTNGVTLSIYDTASLQPLLLTKYSQSYIRPYPVVVSSNELTGYMIAGENTTEPSIVVAKYYTTNCLNDCSWHGVCRDGICICDSGWTGDSCSLPSCGNNCSGNGYCDTATNRCKCDIGYYGLDCSSTDCTGFTVIDTSEGTLTDHIMGSQYPPDQLCFWLIRPSQPSSFISLSFTKFQLENNDDQVVVYDGDSTAAPVLLRASGSFLPNLAKSSTGVMLIEFRSGPRTEFAGFAANFYANDRCACGNYGICLDSSSDCVCALAGKIPPNCTEDAPVTSLEPGNIYNATVKDWNWAFYSYTVNETVGQLSIDVGRTSFNGNPEFYLRYGALPSVTDFTLNNYYYANDPSFSILKPNAGVWFLGVFGRKTEGSNDTRFSVSASIGCVNNCGIGGLCINNLYCICNGSQGFTNCSGNGLCEVGGCKCLPGFYGPSCQFSLCSSPCMNGGQCVGIDECNCQGTGFTGATCVDTNVSHTVCDPPCKNGGVCIPGNICDCSASPYGGPDCTEYVCNPACANNGTCINGHCECPDGYSGDACLVLEPDTAPKQPYLSDGKLVGIIVVVTCVTIGLFSAFIAYVIVRWTKSKSTFIGKAGLDELHDLTPPRQSNSS